MKATREDISSVKKRLVIEIEADEVDRRVRNEFKQVGKKAKIKGFRPGKAPLKILERYFGDQVREDVTGSLIRETLPEAMEETNTVPLNMPVIENEILKTGQKYTYSAILEVKPEFELKDYLGMEVQKENVAVTNEDVDRQLEEIRSASGKLKTMDKDRGIQEGDYAVIDYAGFDGETPIEGIHSTNFSLHVGGKKFYPGFEDALIGLKKGDSAEIELDFDDDYFHSALAGKHVRFEVDIKEIKEIELPELNDDFAGSLGDDFSSLDELRNKVKQELIRREEKRVENELRERILKRISNSVEFELPETLVESEINSTIEHIGQNLIRAGSSMEKSGLDQGKLREEVRPGAESRVKGMIILGHAASQNNLNVDEADISKGFEEMSQGTGHDPREIRSYYEANNLMDAYRQTLLKEKTLNFLVENAILKKVNSSEINDK